VCTDVFVGVALSFFARVDDGAGELDEAFHCCFFFGQRLGGRKVDFLGRELIFHVVAGKSSVRAKHEAEHEEEDRGCDASHGDDEVKTLA